MLSRTKATPFMICLKTPMVTKERFEEESGIRRGQIESQIFRDNLPTVRIGRLVLINLAKMLHEEAALAIIPVMTTEKFATLSGLRERQVVAQMELENIPSRYVGRLRLVDIAKLAKICIENISDTEPLSDNSELE